MIFSIVAHSKVSFNRNVGWYKFAARISDSIHWVLGMIREYLTCQMIEFSNLHNNFGGMPFNRGEAPKYFRSEGEIRSVWTQVPGECDWASRSAAPFFPLSWEHRKHLSIHLVTFNVEGYLKRQLTLFVTPPVLPFGGHNLFRRSSK